MTITELRSAAEGYLDYRADQGLSQATVDLERGKLRQFLDWVENRGD